MIGVGGVLTEVIQETVFRIAPFDLVEAEDMVDELKAKKMLGTFRGEEPADIKIICQCLVALGTLGLDQPQITEIDINPLKILPDGSIRAIDGLIVFSGGEHAENN